MKISLKIVFQAESVKDQNRSGRRELAEWFGGEGLGL